MGRGEMEVHIGIFEPPRMVLLQFMYTQVVKDQMELFPRMLGNECVQEAKELVSAFAREAVCFNLLGGNIQGRKKIGRAMSLILMGKAGKRSAIRHLKPTLLPFQGLDTGFFINGKHHCVCWRAEVEADDVGAFRGELRIRRHAP